MSVRSSIASTAHVTIANSIHGPTRNYLTRQHIRVNTARSQPLGARWSQPARPGSIARSGMHADTGRGGGQRGARGQRAPLLWHLIVDRQPIGRDLDLGSLQWDRARAHLVVQKVLDLILLVKSRLRAGRLRPEVGDVVRAPQLQADEMVDFILTSDVARDAVFVVRLGLFAFRHVPHGASVARLANLPLGRARKESPRSAGGVRSPAAGDAA